MRQFSADILAYNLAAGSRILIENRMKILTIYIWARFLHS